MAIEINGITPLIQVFDMKRSLGFYRDIIGFELVSDSGNGDRSSWVRLRLNGCDLMLNDQYEPGHEPDSPPGERTLWHGDTCLYFGCSDPDEVFEHLQSKDIQCRPPAETAYGMKQLYVRDPDNYNLCFQCPINE